jgi:hypothetical protein
MVDRPFIFQSKLAWHRTENCQTTPFVSIVRTDTFYSFGRRLHAITWQIISLLCL